MITICKECNQDLEKPKIQGGVCLKCQYKKARLRFFKRKLLEVKRKKGL